MSYTIVGFIIVGILIFVNCFNIGKSTKRKGVKANKRIDNNRKLLIKGSNLCREELSKTSEYSRQRSEELGIRDSEIFRSSFERPFEMIKKGHKLMGVELGNRKYLDKSYCEAVSKKISVKVFLETEEIKDRTLQVFVDSIIGETATLIDTTGVCKVKLGGAYVLSGEFALINIDKHKGEVKINYYYKDIY